MLTYGRNKKKTENIVWLELHLSVPTEPIEREPK